MPSGDFYGCLSDGLPTWGALFDQFPRFLTLAPADQRLMAWLAQSKDAGAVSLPMGNSPPPFSSIIGTGKRLRGALMPSLKSHPESFSKKACRSSREKVGRGVACD